MKYNLKKIKKSLFITLLVFSVPALSIFPSTNSKYITERTNWLQYTTNMNSIYRGTINTIGIEPKSTYDNIVISFKFPRSGKALSTDKDIYKIKVNDKCTINPDKVTSKGKKTKLSNNEYQIEYSAGATEDTIRVEYSCKTDSIPEGILNKTTNNLEDTIIVTESFNTEGYDYNYMKGYFSTSYSEYIKDHPIPIAIRDGNKLTIPSNISDNKDRYLEVKNWLKDYFAEDANYDAYIKYFIDTYENDENKIVEPGSLDGLSIEIQADETIVYTIENNYKNYAYTKYRTKDKLSQYKYFYFMGYDNMSDEDINNLFKYYLDKYGYSKETDEYKKIIKYIDNKGGIKNFMVEPNINSYIKWYSSTNEIYIPSLEELLALTNLTSSRYKELKYEANSFELLNFFRSIKEMTIEDSNGKTIGFNSEDFYNHLKNNSELITILKTNKSAINKYIIDNATTSGATTPTGKKYFELTDSDGVVHKLIVRVCSDGPDANGTGTNGVEIILVDDGLDHNLVFNADDSLNEDVNPILGILLGVEEPTNLITTDEWNVDDWTDGVPVTLTKVGKNLTITKTGTKININVTNTNTPATVSEVIESTEPTEPTGETNTNEVDVNNTN